MLFHCGRKLLTGAIASYRTAPSCRGTVILNPLYSVSKTPGPELLSELIAGPRPLFVSTPVSLREAPVSLDSVKKGTIRRGGKKM